MGALAISLLYCSFVLLSRYKEAQADWLSHRVLRIMVLWYFTVGVLYGLFLGIFPLSR